MADPKPAPKKASGKYVVVRDGLVIDGTAYGEGDSVTVVEEDAQWLVRDGMIRQAEGS